MKAPKPKLPPTFVRPSWKPTLETALSYSTRSLLSAYRMARGTEYYVEIPLMPPSVNAMYVKSYNRTLGKMFNSVDKSVLDFRDMTKIACWGRTFKPRGVVGCVIAIEAPGWISLEHKVRERDIDNPIKAVLDALQLSLAMADQIVWEVFNTKIFSRREATHVWLFDLGDVVTAVGGQTKKENATW